MGVVSHFPTRLGELLLLSGRQLVYSTLQPLVSTSRTLVSLGAVPAAPIGVAMPAEYKYPTAPARRNPTTTGGALDAHHFPLVALWREQFIQAITCTHPL